MTRLAWFTAIAALACGGSALAATGLQSGAATSLSMPASTFVPNFYIDVDGSAKQLKINVAATGGDVDLFLRFGTPFPESNADTIVGEDLINRYAHYHSISSSSNEAITVLPTDRMPLRAGRWYITVMNGGTTAASGSLTATVAASVPAGNITLDFGHPGTDCDQTYWSDSTPATPVGGNTGTTLGQQRKNALTYATQQLVQQLQTPAQIVLHACGAHLGGDENSAILAHAGPLSYFFDEPAFPVPSLPKKYTWYPAAAVVRLNGTSLCGFAGGACDDLNNQEIEATFNSDIGKSTVIGGENFYLGFTPDPNPGSLDFITIAMHEITHGLGFFGLANLDSSAGPIGAKAGVDTQNNTIAYGNDVTDGPYDDVFDDNLAIVNGSTYTPFMGYEVNGSGDAARAAAAVSGPTVTSAGTYNPGVYTGLRWLDAAAVNSSVNIHHTEASPNNLPSLYAPCDKSSTTTCATQPASTLSHTVQSGDMMNAYYSRSNLRNMGLAVPMLGPVGWSNALATPPAYAQPIPSNWFDRTRSGHGFDFQLAYADPIYGDVYFLTFYTYAADGTPEWYQAYGHVVDGVFAPALQQNGSTLYRIHYAANTQGHLEATVDPAFSGDVVVDFNQAAASPVCRNTDRGGIAGALAVMTWNIGGQSGESGKWCVEPLVTVAQHTPAPNDYNGHWFAPTDSGWGFELLDVAGSGGTPPSIYAYVYYPGPNNLPTWAFATGTLNNNGTGTMQLQQIDNGYCRSCPTPTDLTTTVIGTMSISLNPRPPGFAPLLGTASIQASYPGGGSFTRNNIAIQTLSTPFP